MGRALGMGKGKEREVIAGTGDAAGVPRSLRVSWSGEGLNESDKSEMDLSLVSFFKIKPGFQLT